MTRNNKGRDRLASGGLRKTADGDNRNGGDQQTVRFNPSKPSRNRPQKRRWTGEQAMNAAEKFLSRVEHKQTGSGRWQFRVPTRKDRHMSGALREPEDGRIPL